jgi:hypothetical protein
VREEGGLCPHGGVGPVPAWRFKAVMWLYFGVLTLYAAVWIVFIGSCFQTLVWHNLARCFRLGDDGCTCLGW